MSELKTLNGYKLVDTDARESITELAARVETKTFQIIDGSAVVPGMVQNGNSETMAEIIDYLRELVNYNVIIYRMIMPATGDGATIRKHIGHKLIRNDDDTFNAIVYFGDDLAPIIFDSVNNTVSLDPTWTAQ